MSLRTNTSCSSNNLVKLPITDIFKYILTKKTDWEGLTSFYGCNIWGDGINTYHVRSSSESLSLNGSVWTSKTFSDGCYGSSSAKCYWTDGTNIYYSNAAYRSSTGEFVSSSSYQYVYDSNTKTFSSISWNIPISGNNIWTDGENIYHSRNNISDENVELSIKLDYSGTYILNKETSEWSLITWNGFTNIDGEFIWSDGINIYYSFSTEQYVLNKDTNTWEYKQWDGFQTINGKFVWTDGTNIYYFYNADKYKLNKETSTWEKMEWTWGYSSSDFDGDDFWSDGVNIYWSHGTSQYVFTLPTVTIDGISYTYEQGMTWEEWVSSDYNIDKLFELKDYEFGTIVINSKTGKFLCSGNNVLNSYDTIVYNVSYFTKRLTVPIRLSSLEGWEAIVSGNLNMTIKATSNETTYLDSVNSNSVVISKK